MNKTMDSDFEIISANMAFLDLTESELNRPLTREEMIHYNTIDLMSRERSAYEREFLRKKIIENGQKVIKDSGIENLLSDLLKDYTISELMDEFEKDFSKKIRESIERELMTVDEVIEKET